MEAAEVERCIDQYGKEIYGFCRRLTMNDADAEDLYQQTFLKLLEIKGSMRWGENPRALLFGITSGLWKNEWRKRRRRERIAPRISLDNEEIASEPAGKEDTENEALDRILRQEMRAAIQRLRPIWKIPVLLYYGHGLTEEEIGRIEQVPVGTVKSRLYQARKQLRREMEERGYDAGK